MTSKPITFFVIEDDDVDFWATERALYKMDLTNPVVRAHDGQEALQVLKNGRGDLRPGDPLIILLDLNMPRIGGLDFLDALNTDPSLSHHKVIVVTTSTMQDDLMGAYKHNICGYVVKYDLQEGLEEALDDLSMPRAFMAA